MRRSDFGSRNSGAGGGLFGTLFGGQGGTRQAQQPAGPNQDKITPRGASKVDPTTKQVSIGVTLYGDVVNLPLFEKATLICGQSGSGKSFCSNRILMEIFKIPKEQRVVVGIDLKSGTEIGKSQYCLDAFGINLENADTIITNIAAEMDRRHRLINSNPQKYWDGKTHPSREVPLIVCFVDELAMLGKKATDKELEEIRKHAWTNFDRLLYLGRNAGICTISCIQRPDAKIVDSFTRAQYQCRLCGYVSNRTDNDMVFGNGAAEQGIDASKLSDHWFWGFVEGKGYSRFKVPGEFDDSDLKEVFLNPDYYAPKGRGDWLMAEPDTPEAIAPWWPDSPYHEDYLNGFRDDEAEPAHRQYANEEECTEYWDEDEDGHAVSRPARRAPRPHRASNRPAEATEAEYEAPWDEPRRPSPSAYEDLRETSMEEIMDMVSESAGATEADGPRIEYRKAKQDDSAFNDLKASFVEMDDDDQSFWGEKVIQGDDDDEMVSDYGEAWWGVVADIQDGAEERLPLPPYEASTRSESPSPAHTRKEPPRNAIPERAPKASSGGVRRRRRRSEVDVRP